MTTPATMNSQPASQVSADLNIGNILEGKRSRRPVKELKLPHPATPAPSKRGNDGTSTDVSPPTHFQRLGISTLLSTFPIPLISSMQWTPGLLLNFQNLLQFLKFLNLLFLHFL